MAHEFLVGQGLRLKARNYRTRRGEIDLIMQAQGCIVFVEVKYRNNNKFGTAEASITRGKCQRMIAAAQEYLMRNGHAEDTAIRFDAVLLSESEDAVANCTINWIQNILT
jgi:putative endonuclease